MRPRPALAALALAAAGLALVPEPDPVGACALVPPKGGRVDVSAETAVIVWDAKAKVEHFVRSASFATTSAEFGFLVPTPGRPEVAAASPAVYGALAKVTEPRTEVRTKTRIGGCYGEKSETFANVGAALAPQAAADSVRVLERSKVGAFDYAVLQADDPAALREWLGTNGFDARPELEGWLKAYTKN